MSKRELAYIESTTLGIEDHGLPSSFLMLHGADEPWGQGFGGFHLGGPAMHAWVTGVLSAVGVDDWSRLVGQHVWVERDGDGLGSAIVAIQGVGKGKEMPRFHAKEAMERLRAGGTPS